MSESKVHNSVTTCHITELYRCARDAGRAVAISTLLRVGTFTTLATTIYSLRLQQQLGKRLHYSATENE